MDRTLPVCGNRGNPPISGIRAIPALLTAVFGLIAAPVPSLAQESVRFASLDADIANGTSTEIEAREKPAGKVATDAPAEPAELFRWGYA